MAITLYNVAHSMFDPIPPRGRAVRPWSETVHAFTDEKYIEIPLVKDKPFEVPAFVIDSFLSSSDVYESSTLAIRLNTSGYGPYYKTLDKNMKELLLSKFMTFRLVKLKDDRDEDILYYITQGAIFDKDFNPIFMASWLLHFSDDPSVHWVLDRPILRIVPDVIVHQNTPIERYIVKKLLPVILDTEVERIGEFTRRSTGVVVAAPEGIAKVELTEIPFTIRGVDSPSYSTTRDSLIKTVLDNIDDVI